MYWHTEFLIYVLPVLDVFPLQYNHDDKYITLRWFRKQYNAKTVFNQRSGTYENHEHSGKCIPRT